MGKLHKLNNYLDLRGVHYDLALLDKEERVLLDRLYERFEQSPAWNEFENEWTQVVQNFYQSRRLERSAIRRTSVYKIAQDLGSRLAIAQGLARY